MKVGKQPAGQPKGSWWGSAAGGALAALPSRRRMPDATRIPDAPWNEIPTVKEALGVDIQYQMLRGIFGPPGMPKDAVDWYVAFLRKVFDSPEFKKYLEDGALKPAFSTGAEYTKWVDENEKLHKDLMAKGGLLPK